ncbi:ATP-binding protein [Streptomyces sp. NPDC048436]|uniref:ATP-binding protein n=1 Tax=Streptomyces sp. NPDC048436 TaxID=3365550 RepID=UPI003723C7AD
MKQSAVKTLGVAALGAAFAAAGAGAATAAPVEPGAAAALATTASTLPLDGVASTLPPGGPEAVSAGQNAVGSGLTAAAPTVDRLVESTKQDKGDQGAAAAEPAAAKPAAGPLEGLLGGLPLAKGLPLQGLPLNGLPLG